MACSCHVWHMCERPGSDFWECLQSLLTPEHAIVAETGDSWFNCLKLKLPDGCGCAPHGHSRCYFPLAPWLG